MNIDLNRKPRRKKSAAKPAFDELDALTDTAPQAVACKPHRWEHPEFIKSWQYMAAFFEPKDAIEKRDLERFKACQAKITAEFGMRVELADEWQQKWPASPPAPSLDEEAQR